MPVKLRHGIDGFTSPPKDGMLRIFFALKIRRLRPGANLRTFVPKVITLPLDHRSRFLFTLLFYPEDGDCRVLRNVYTFLPEHKKPHLRKQFFVDTAMRCISNLTYRLTCYAVRTFRRVTLLSSLVRVWNGGLRIWRMLLHGVRIRAVTIWNVYGDVRQGCQDANAVVFRACVLLLSWIT
jgi:hypothetical protein